MPRALEKPIQFLQFEKDESGKEHWVMQREAIDFLTSVQQPLAVIAIVGMYRTGKSFIMNQLLNRTDGFDVGSTMSVQAPLNGDVLSVILALTESGYGKFAAPPMRKCPAYLPTLVSYYWTRRA